MKTSEYVELICNLVKFLANNSDVEHVSERETQEVVEEVLNVIFVERMGNTHKTESERF